MHKTDKRKPAFLKPKHHILKRNEFKRCSKASVFGLTTSMGTSLVVPCPLHPRAHDWTELLRERVAPFLAESYPSRRSYTLLLGGESIFHTDEAKAAMRDCGVRVLPYWPAHSPDLKPQENVWACESLP